MSKYTIEVSDERAHSGEDDLRERVLRHIADNPTDPNIAQMAKLALGTSLIEFSRWCA